MSTCRDACDKQEQKVWRIGEVGDSKLEKLWVFGESVCILHPLRNLFATTYSIKPDQTPQTQYPSEFLQIPSKTSPKKTSRCLLSLTSTSKEPDRNTAISATTRKQSSSATSQSSQVKAAGTTTATSISTTGSNKSRTLSRTLTEFFELPVSAAGRM
jgi:hypothetical protein